MIFWEKESSGQACGTVGKDSKYELAFSIDRPELYKEYLQKALLDFVRDYGDSVGKILPDFSFEAEKMKRLYIGNQFCPQLFPEEKILFEMLDKAAGRGSKSDSCIFLCQRRNAGENGKIAEEIRFLVPAEGADAGAGSQ